MTTVPLLLLTVVPAISVAFLFGNQACNCFQQPAPYVAPQPAYQPAPYYPPAQPSYVAPQPQPYVPQPQPYVPEPQPYVPQSQGYVTAPTYNRGPANTYSRGHTYEFVSEGTIPMRPSPLGEPARYNFNRYGSNTVTVLGQNTRTLVPPFRETVISEPSVDVRPSTFAQTPRPVEKVYTVATEPTPVVPEPSYEKQATVTVVEETRVPERTETVYQPQVDEPTRTFGDSHPVDSTTEFTNENTFTNEVNTEAPAQYFHDDETTTWAAVPEQTNTGYRKRKYH